MTDGVHAPGNAGSNTAADHIQATKLALAQLPKRLRRGRQTLIRTDSGGGTHEFVDWLARRGRWLSYSVGMTITDAIHFNSLYIDAAVKQLAADGFPVTDDLLACLSPLQTTTSTFIWTNSVRGSGSTSSAP